MKKYLSIGALLITIGGLVACEGGLYISNANQDGSNGPTSSNKSTPPIATYNWISDEKSFQPIAASNITEPSTEINFSSNMNKINETDAQNLINNDFSVYPSDKSINQMTSITYKKEHARIMTNRSTSTYSLKEQFEEKYIIRMVDHDKKWAYKMIREDTTNQYFVEEQLIRHTISETLNFVKDNDFYTVYSEQSYYEGEESKGTFESYFVKRENLEEEQYFSTFTIRNSDCTYFNETGNFNKLSNSIYENFAGSSSWYEASDYKNITQDTKGEYYFSSTPGNFRYIANDLAEYYFADLKDYPSDERSALSKICYDQNYSLTIVDYFNFVENYETNSVSMDSKNNVIRAENKIGKKTVLNQCKAFYPDLDKYEEREYTPPIHR